MKARSLDPRRLDLAALCHDGGSLQGEWALGDLPRLAAGALPWSALPGDAPAHTQGPTQGPTQGHAGAGEPPPVVWQARAWLQPVRAGVPERWLELHARATVVLECQRCLQPLPVALDARRRLRFVDTEEEAARLDEDSEDDVLALPRRLDLRELVEDELILALPIVPRHDTCPHPLPTRAPAAADAGVDAVADADATLRPAAAADDDPGPDRQRPFAALAALRRTRPPH